MAGLLTCGSMRFRSFPAGDHVPVPVVNPKRSPLTVAGAVVELDRLNLPSLTTFPFHPGHKFYASQEPSVKRLSLTGMSRQSRSEAPG